MNREAPRLLVIDPTPIGSLCATGQFKGMLFRDWPRDKIVELTTDFNGSDETVLRWGMEKIERFVSESGAIARIREFEPQSIYVRPEPSNVQHFDLVLLALEELPYPAALHIMDDWVAGDLLPTKAGADNLLKVSRYFADRTDLRYTDGPAYIADFKLRLHADFVNLLNAVDLERWETPLAPASGNHPFTLTHMGNWDAEMSRQAIMEIAEVVERLQSEFEIRLHVHVRDYAVEAARRDLAPWSRSQVFEQEGEFESYVHTLRSSDINLYAYNQDPISVRYMGKGIPNKTCELLAARKPILAYGPEQFGGIKYLRDNGAASIVVDRNDLYEAIKGLRLGTRHTDARAEQTLRQNHDAKSVRAGFTRSMLELSNRKGRETRSAAAQEANARWHELLRPQIISLRRHKSIASRVYGVLSESKALAWRLQNLSGKIASLRQAATSSLYEGR